LDCTTLAVGTLDGRWSERLGGLRVRAAGRGFPVTELSGPLLDQAALFEVLIILYDLGCPLLSVDCRVPQEPAGGDTPTAESRLPDARER
jgi:hypothetical protein